MSDKLESLIKVVYGRWRKRTGIKEIHLDEEVLAGLLDGCLTKEEEIHAWHHLAACHECTESLSLVLKGEEAQIKEVPEVLLHKAKEILDLKEEPRLLEVILGFKENMFEIIKVTGDILLGQELIPAAVLRSRNIKNIKNEVIILKDFRDIRLEVKVENKEGKFINILIQVKHKQGYSLIKNLRVTLIKDDLELESYFSEFGSVSFEHLLLGKYTLEVSSLGERLASVVLDMKV